MFQGFSNDLPNRFENNRAQAILEDAAYFRKWIH
jgi:hypothetical protein